LVKVATDHSVKYIPILLHTPTARLNLILFLCLQFYILLPHFGYPDGTTFHFLQGQVMKKLSYLILMLLANPVFAGDLWEINSKSVGPDGNPQPFTQKICLPSGAADPSNMLGGLGSCTMDQKNGDASAMTFAMTCKIPGMPADLASMKVTGDAKLMGNKFDMRYTISLGGDQKQPGGDFKMNGDLEALKVGTCTER